MAADSRGRPRSLPGRHELPREFIVEHQRRRITSALAEVVAERGYRDATVAEIVKRARIARNTFYDNFSSKEECFLAAFDRAVEETMQRVTAAYETPDGGWSGKVRASLAAFLEYVAGEPALARMCIVEALSAGAAAVDRYEAAIEGFVPLLRPGRELAPEGRVLPDTLEETVIGGIFWIVYQRIATGQTARLPGLTPQLTEFALTPYLGPAAAREVAAGS